MTRKRTSNVEPRPSRGAVWRTRDAVSAGGVVYRRGPDGIEVVICGTNDGMWRLPKGTPEPGESLEETAVREVSEETGLQVTIGQPVTTIEYWFVQSDEGVRVHKKVYHYLLESTGGSTNDHDHEHDIVIWAPLDEAIRRLSFPNEVDVLRKAAALLEEATP